jgi:hypothetical protein
VTDRLPELLDRAGVERETGLKRHSAEALMRRVPKVVIEGLKKNLVRRSDVFAYLEEHTFTNDEVPGPRR